MLLNLGTRRLRWDKIDSILFWESALNIKALVKEQSRLTLETIHSPRGQSMYGMNYILIVCMLVVQICSTMK